jgi:hypothetical protein
MNEISADEATFQAAHSAVQQVGVDLAEVFDKLGDNALSAESRGYALALLRMTLDPYREQLQLPGVRPSARSSSPGSAAEPNKPAPSRNDPANPVEDIPTSVLTSMIRDLCPSAWAPIEDAMLRVLRHPGTGPGPEREGLVVPIGLCVLTATESMADVGHLYMVPGPLPKAPETPEARETGKASWRKRNASLRFVTVLVPHGAYFSLVAALEARIADGAVQCWCDQDPYGQVNRHDVVRYVARLREHALALRG